MYLVVNDNKGTAFNSRIFGKKEWLEKQVHLK